MCPPAAKIGSNCTNEELFVSLEQITSGARLPNDVLDDINPYNYVPSNLPEDAWFLLSSKVNTVAEHGTWKTVGQTDEVFSNSAIIGWRTTSEYYEGKPPHQRKTDWVMQVFDITDKKMQENTKAKEAMSLCRVFFDDEKSLLRELYQLVSSTNPRQLPPLRTTNGVNMYSTSNPMVNRSNGTRVMAAEERHPDHYTENLPEINYLAGGDFLELLDLDNPASPSSSSDTSSCLTMSSDECFDMLASLQDLEPNNDCIREDNINSYRFNAIESHEPTEVVVLPPASGSIICVRETNLVSIADPTLGNDRERDGKATSQPTRENGGHVGEGPSTRSQNLTRSSSSHGEAINGKRKAAEGRMRKLKRKYLCFMPF